MLDNLKIYDFKGSNCKDTDLTLSKFMLEAADICPVKSWRAIAIDKFGSQEVYRYDFGIGSGITDEEMKEAENSIHLKTTYYEVFEDDKGLPDVKAKSLEVVFIAKEENGERNIAVESSIYRTFAAMSQQAIKIYNTRLIGGPSYLGKEGLIF